MEAKLRNLRDNLTTGVRIVDDLLEEWNQVVQLKLEQNRVDAASAIQYLQPTNEKVKDLVDLLSPLGVPHLMFVRDATNEVVTKRPKSRDRIHYDPIRNCIESPNKILDKTNQDENINSEKRMQRRSRTPINEAPFNPETPPSRNRSTRSSGSIKVNKTSPPVQANATKPKGIKFTIDLEPCRVQRSPMLSSHRRTLSHQTPSASLQGATKHVSSVMRKDGTPTLASESQKSPRIQSKSGAVESSTGTTVPVDDHTDTHDVRSKALLGPGSVLESPPEASAWQKTLSIPLVTATSSTPKTPTLNTASSLIRNSEQRSRNASYYSDMIRSFIPEPVGGTLRQRKKNLSRGPAFTERLTQNKRIVLNSKRLATKRVAEREESETRTDRDLSAPSKPFLKIPRLTDDKANSSAMSKDHSVSQVPSGTKSPNHPLEPATDGIVHEIAMDEDGGAALGPVNSRSDKTYCVGLRVETLVQNGNASRNLDLDMLGTDADATVETVEVTVAGRSGRKASQLNRSFTCEAPTFNLQHERPAATIANLTEELPAKPKSRSKKPTQTSLYDQQGNQDSNARPKRDIPKRNYKEPLLNRKATRVKQAPQLP